MNKKKLRIAIVVSIAILIILVFFLSDNENTIISENKINNIDGLNYEFDKNTEMYIVYDENGNERGKAEDEGQLKKFIDNPDYNEEYAPSDFTEHSKLQDSLISEL